MDSQTTHLTANFPLSEAKAPQLHSPPSTLHTKAKTAAPQNLRASAVFCFYYLIFLSHAGAAGHGFVKYISVKRKAITPHSTLHTPHYIYPFTAPLVMPLMICSWKRM